MTWRFGSLAEKTYRLEFRATQGDLAGTGVERTICETAASAGFYRVTLLP